LKKNSFHPTILITGCSSGIGLALAEKLYSQSEYRVVVTARKQSFEVLKSKFPDTSTFLVRSMDVTLEQERAQVLKEIATLWGGVNILINNAGVSYRAVVEHMTIDEEQHQFDTNYFAPVALMRAVLPYMRACGRGKIINVSSVSGMLGSASTRY
jgi:short-subunit dehydrogenase